MNAIIIITFLTTKHVAPIENQDYFVYTHIRCRTTTVRTRITWRSVVSFLCSATQKTHRVVQLPVQFANHPTDSLSYVLVTTKAYQARDAVSSMPPRLDLDTTVLTPRQNCYIVLICNGVLTVRDDLHSLLTEQQHDNKHVEIVLGTMVHMSPND